MEERMSLMIVSIDLH